MTTVAVIDYGMGNLHSVAKALQYVNAHANVVVTSERRELEQANRVVFPGVGALRDCLSALRQRDMEPTLRKCLENKPALGICLGMQALLDFSEENDGTTGLGVVPGKALRFKEQTDPCSNDERLKIPHMGWNQVHQVRPHPLWEGIPQASRFYFVHSYYVVPAAASVVAGETCYGTTFAAAIARENLFAVQFHPEKSQKHGLQLLANFLRWDGNDSLK